MIRTKRRENRFLLFFVSFLVLAVTAGVAWVAIGGGGPGGQDGDGDKDQVASSEPDVEWITRVVRVSVLQRLIQENGSEEVMGNAHYPSEERLQEGGVLVGESSDQRVQVDRGQWNLGFDVGITSGAMDGALADFMRTNTVTWCGGERPADDFVESYIRSHEGQYRDVAEYEASIEDYVDCGSG